MVSIPFIGPRTLSNDCNHSATAIFWRSAEDQIEYHKSRLACWRVMWFRHASQKKNSRIKWGGVPPRPDHRRCPNPGFGGPTRSETHWHQVRWGRDSGVEPFLTQGTQCQANGPPA